MKTLLALLLMTTLAITPIPVGAKQGFFDSFLEAISDDDDYEEDYEEDDGEYDTYNVQYADGSSYQGSSKQEYEEFIRQHESQQTNSNKGIYYNSNPRNRTTSQANRAPASEQNVALSSSGYGENLLQPEMANGANDPASRAINKQYPANRGAIYHPQPNGNNNSRYSNYQRNNNRDYRPQNNRTSNELQDFGVPAPAQLYSGNFHAPTPTSIPGGRVITTTQLKSMVMQGQYGQSNTLIFDVLDGYQVLPGAIPASQGAAPGNFNDNTQQRMGYFLNQVTGGNKNVNMVYYCQNINCWMSYNAALRAINLGYRNVYWYRGGIDAWMQQGLTVQTVNYNNVNYSN